MEARQDTNTRHRRVGNVMGKGQPLRELRQLDRFGALQVVRTPFDGSIPSVESASGPRIVHQGEEACTFKRVAAERVSFRS